MLADAVRQHAERSNQPAVRTRYCFGMNVPGKMVFLSQEAKRFNHAFAGIVRVAEHAGAF